MKIVAGAAQCGSTKKAHVFLFRAGWFHIETAEWEQRKATDKKLKIIKAERVGASERGGTKHKNHE